MIPSLDASSFFSCILSAGGSGAFCVFLVDLFDDYDLDELFTHLLFVDECASLSTPHIPHPTQASSSLLPCALDRYSLISHEPMRLRAPPQARVPLYTNVHEPRLPRVPLLRWRGSLFPAFLNGVVRNTLYSLGLFLTLTTFTTLT